MRAHNTRLVLSATSSWARALAGSYFPICPTWRCLVGHLRIAMHASPSQTVHSSIRISTPVANGALFDSLSSDIVLKRNDERGFERDSHREITQSARTRGFPFGLSPGRLARRVATAAIPVLGGYWLVLAVFADVNGAEALAQTLGLLGPTAVLGVCVWRLTVWWSWPARSTTWFFFRHSIAAVGFALLWVTAFLTVTQLIHATDTISRAHAFMGWEFALGITLYATLAALIYAARFDRQRRQAEIATARAQVEAIRTQLSPHFIFNSLQSVAGLIRTDAPAAESALEGLGDLFRYVLRHASVEAVTFEQEWKFTQQYLALMRLRFGERLRVRADVDSDLDDFPVPPFTLQLLVENAIRHGVARSQSGGEVRIRVSGKAGVDIIVENLIAQSGAAVGPNGIGLDAVERQLRTLYGRHAELTTGVVDGSLYRASIRIAGGWQE